MKHNDLSGRPGARVQRTLGTLLLLTLTACAGGPPAAPATPRPTVAPPPPTAAPTPPAAYSNARVIEKYRRQLPQILRENNIPGLALAVVDDQQVLWAEGFGVADPVQNRPVTADTLFSVQSMSKNFTAIAVLMAAQDGLLDMQTPISAYLPDFHVNSIFEAHPEQKMTLTDLLGHTAGFTHETPVGNNEDVDAGTFEDHIRSLADTWLMFPVGQSYHYSNSGPDLAGYILQVRSGLAFPRYMQERLLDPIGMTHSTFDITRIEQTADRAIGHAIGFPTIPVAVPMLPAGGLYTNANDMAKYLQFQINGGVAAGRRVVPASLLETVAAPPSPLTRAVPQGYGVFVGRNHNTYYIGSGGGGFGFLSDMLWYPELRLGIATLTNSADHQLQGVLDSQILDDLIADPGTVFHARALALTGRTPAPWETAAGAGTPPPPTPDVPALIRQRALAPTAQDHARWAAYTGTYDLYTWGELGMRIPVYEQEGRLYLNAGSGPVPLTEVQPGLFFTPDGEAIDLRGPRPIAAGMYLTKEAPGTPTIPVTGTP